MENIGTLTLIVLALATYRLTRLVVADTFPFEKFRLNSHGTWVGKLVTCPFCMSVWTGAFVATGQGLVGDVWGWQVFIGALSLSAVTSLLASIFPQSFE